MNYAEVLDYLFNQVPMFHREGAAAYKPGLDLIRKLCELMGNPQMSYPCIHVAGTNGKGSTSSMLSSVLQVSGKKVGLFTSPHIRDFRERMKVNNEIPTEGWVIGFMEHNMPLFLELKPTFFEMTTAMAFTYFAESKVDMAVIEVGMGGRLDATNIIEPVLSVITNIGLDHMDFLGDTLEKIAMEKAGIIKQNIPVVVGEAEGALRVVFESKAKECGAPLVFADQTHAVRDWNCALKGIYQEKNKCTVFAAIQALNAFQSMGLTDQMVEQGFAEVLQRTGLMGRWQQLSVVPKIICDTGHNAHGMRYVVEQLEQERGDHRLWIVFGMVKDKDITSVLRLLPKDAYYLFTQASIPRAMPREQLAEMARAFELKGETVVDVPTAIARAKSMAGPDDLIFIGGSTFIVSEIKTDSYADATTP